MAKYTEEIFEFEGISITNPMWDCTHRFQLSLTEAIKFYGKKNRKAVCDFFERYADLDAVMNAIIDIGDGDEDQYPDSCTKVFSLLKSLKNGPVFIDEIPDAEELYRVFGFWMNGDILD